MTGSRVHLKVDILDPVLQLSLIQRLHVEIWSLDIVLKVPDARHLALKIFKVVSTSINNGLTDLV